MGEDGRPPAGAASDRSQHDARDKGESAEPGPSAPPPHANAHAACTAGGAQRRSRTHHHQPLLGHLASEGVTCEVGDHAGGRAEPRAQWKKFENLVMCTVLNPHGFHGDVGYTQVEMRGTSSLSPGRHRQQSNGGQAAPKPCRRGAREPEDAPPEFLPTSDAGKQGSQQEHVGGHGSLGITTSTPGSQQEAPEKRENPDTTALTTGSQR